MCKSAAAALVAASVAVGRRRRCATQTYSPAPPPPPPPPQTAPEIQRTSLVSAVLYLKSLPLSLDVLGFDYLDAPAVGRWGAGAGWGRHEYCSGRWW